MRGKARVQLLTVLGLAFARAAAAQDAVAPAATAPADAPAVAPATTVQAAPATPGAAPGVARTLVLHANTLVSLRFTETVGSDVSKPGTLFQMKVTDDINVDDAVLIPTGSIAVGEVIDSQPARALGKSGKLVVSARYIQVGDRQVKLHSMLGTAGNSPVVAALFVPFIHGQQAEIPADTEVVAKTAHDESFDVAPAAPH